MAVAARFVRAVAASHRAAEFTLAWLGPFSLALVLLSGAMKIGEAARICLFILPYLLLPVIAAWRGAPLGPDQFRVAQAVFAWGLLMQLFGFYQW